MIDPQRSSGDRPDVFNLSGLLGPLAESQNTIYLDHATTSFPKAPHVYETMAKIGASHGVSPGRGTYDLAHTSELIVRQARRSVARLIGVESFERVCFSLNATDSLNQILFGVLTAGDRVLSTRLEHNSVLRPLHALSKHGVQVELISTSEDGRVDLVALAKALQVEQTRLVIMTHASNVLGTVQPIGEVAELCRRWGAWLAVDASQSAGAIEIHAQATGIDLIAMSGHKSLMGPSGVGILWVRPGLDLRPSRFGGTGHASSDPEPPQDYPARLEPGTPNVPGIIGLQQSLEWLESQGIDTIHAHATSLRRQLREGLDDIAGVRVFGTGEGPHVGMVTCALESMDSQSTAQLLDAGHGIACRAGLHCAPLVHEDLGTRSRGGAVRFSFGPFNTPEQIEAAIEAVAKIHSRAR